MSYRPNKELERITRQFHMKSIVTVIIGACILGVAGGFIGNPIAPYIAGFGIFTFVIAILMHNKEREKKRQYFQQQSRNSNTSLMISCLACQKQISKNAISCPNCGEPTLKRCPMCNSENVERIDNLNKSVSVVATGVLAANTVLSSYVCKACGEKFK